jgi:hypothetical protein
MPVWSSHSMFRTWNFSDLWRPWVNEFLYSPMKMILLVLLQEQWKLIWLGQHFNVQRQFFYLKLHASSTSQNVFVLFFTITILFFLQDAQDLGLSIELLPLSPPDDQFNMSLFYAVSLHNCFFSFSLCANCWTISIAQDLIGLDGDEMTEYLPSAGDKYYSWNIDITYVFFRFRWCLFNGTLFLQSTSTNK